MCAFLSAKVCWDNTRVAYSALEVSKLASSPMAAPYRAILLGPYPPYWKGGGGGGGAGR